MRRIIAYLACLILIHAGEAAANNCKELAFTAITKSDLRNLLAAQESYANSHESHYASTLTALDSIEYPYKPSPYVKVELLNATATSWRARATYTGKPESCVIFVGTNQAQGKDEVGHETEPICTRPMERQQLPAEDIWLACIAAAIAIAVSAASGATGVTRVILIGGGLALAIQAFVPREKVACGFSQPGLTELLVALLALTSIIAGLIAGTRRLRKRPA